MFRLAFFREKAEELKRALCLSDDDAKREVLTIFSKASKLNKLELLMNPSHFEDQKYVKNFDCLFRRRLTGEPLPLITEEIEFYGLCFQVNSDVLIPRPDSETLIDSLLARVGDSGSKTLLELGVGSGILSITALKNIAGLEVVATDISSDAIKVAARNADRILGNRDNIRFLLGDWFDPVIGHFDFIISNPPYIAEGDVHLEDSSMSFEPKIALTSGSDGFRDLSLIIDKSPEYLNSGGWLILEHGFDQSSRVTAAMREVGFEEIFTDCDLSGRLRVSGGKMPKKALLDI
jgi:release factor glutamine methyltransferase